jgi:hypothetical protein
LTTVVLTTNHECVTCFTTIRKYESNAESCLRVDVKKIEQQKVIARYDEGGSRKQAQVLLRGGPLFLVDSFYCRAL